MLRCCCRGVSVVLVVFVVSFVDGFVDQWR